MASFEPKQIHIISGSAAAAFLICCMQFIAPHEGEVHKAYLDVGNKWTICDGHRKNVKEGDVATKPQCQQFLKEDTLDAIVTVNILTDNAPIPEAAKKVFVDEVFNAGSGNFRKSIMLRLIKAGDYEGACRQFPRWHYAGGKDCTIRANNCYGIVKRRAEQMAACLKGLKQ